jgi:fatty acid desaturase
MTTDQITQTTDTSEAASVVKNLAYYNKIISAHLKPEFFERNPLRLNYLMVFLLSNIGIVYLVLNFELHWGLKIILGLCVGYFNSALAFISHETSHGSVVKSKNLQDAIVFFAFAPFMMSPTYWRFWHNRLHHGNTQYVLKDPDAFPTMSVFKNSKYLQNIFAWTPGSKSILSYSYFFFWFSFQSLLNQTHMRFKNKMWDEMNHKRVTLEFLAQVVLVGIYIYVMGMNNLFFMVMIPMLVQNYVLVSYISTNHNLSPLTKVNDPLMNSLTVTNHKVFDFMHLNFGYHVEHHIFPRMSGAYTKKTHEVMKKIFPETYQFMKKSEALKLLYATARIYKNPTTLVNPLTLETYKTL